MQFGRYYEEFEVGAVYKHWPGKTVTEYDDHLFCLLTMNHHPLHLDAHYARGDHRLQAQRGGRQLRLLAAAGHVGARRVGQGDRQPRGRVAASTPSPTFHGDTIYGETEVLDKTPSRVEGRPRRRLRRDPRLQAGRHGRLHVPAQGDGAQAVLRRRARRRAAGPARAAADRPGRGPDASGGGGRPTPVRVLEQQASTSGSARQRRRRRTSGRRAASSPARSVPPTTVQR